MCLLKRERLLLKDVIIFRNNDHQIDMEKKVSQSHYLSSNKKVSSTYVLMF